MGHTHWELWRLSLRVATELIRMGTSATTTGQAPLTPNVSLAFHCFLSLLKLSFLVKMPHKHQKSKHSMGSVSWSQETLSDTDEDDTTSAVEVLVKTTSRYVTFEADSSGPSRLGKRTRFMEEIEARICTSDVSNLGDISVPPEFEAWLGDDPIDAFTNEATFDREEDGQNIAQGSENDHYDSHDDDDELSGDVNVADYVAFNEANANKSQRVCLFPVLLAVLGLTSFLDKNNTRMGRFSRVSPRRVALARWDQATVIVCRLQKRRRHGASYALHRLL